MAGQYGCTSYMYVNELIYILAIRVHFTIQPTDAKSISRIRLKYPYYYDNFANMKGVKLRSTFDDPLDVSFPIGHYRHSLGCGCTCKSSIIYQTFQK